MSEFYKRSTMKESKLKPWYMPICHMVAGELQATRTYKAMRIIKTWKEKTS
jgi:hypothetical protein